MDREDHHQRRRGQQQQRHSRQRREKNVLSTLDHNHFHHRQEGAKSKPRKPVGFHHQDRRLPLSSERKRKPPSRRRSSHGFQRQHQQNSASKRRRGSGELRKERRQNQSQFRGSSLKTKPTIHTLDNDSSSDDADDEGEEPQNFDDDDDSDMEAPYYQPLKFPGLSQMLLDPIPAKKVQEEPLRPGDIIEYTNPLFVAGSKQGRRVAQVLAVKSRGDFVLELDNDELLPNDTRIRRVREFRDNRLFQHAGIYRQVEDFKLVAGRLTNEKFLQRKVQKIKKILEEGSKEAQKIFLETFQKGKTHKNNGGSSSSSSSSSSDSHSSDSSSKGPPKHPSKGQGATNASAVDLLESSGADSDLEELLRPITSIKRKKRSPSPQKGNSSKSNKPKEIVRDLPQRRPLQSPRQKQDNVANKKKGPLEATSSEESDDACMVVDGNASKPKSASPRAPKGSPSNVLVKQASETQTCKSRGVSPKKAAPSFSLGKLQRKQKHGNSLGKANLGAQAEKRNKETAARAPLITRKKRSSNDDSIDLLSSDEESTVDDESNRNRKETKPSATPAKRKDRQSSDSVFDFPDNTQDDRVAAVEGFGRRTPIFVRDVTNPDQRQSSGKKSVRKTPPNSTPSSTVSPCPNQRPPRRSLRFSSPMPREQVSSVRRHEESTDQSQSTQENHQQMDDDLADDEEKAMAESNDESSQSTRERQFQSDSGLSDEEMNVMRKSTNKTSQVNHSPSDSDLSDDDKYATRNANGSSQPPQGNQSDSDDDPSDDEKQEQEIVDISSVGTANSSGTDTSDSEKLRRNSTSELCIVSVNRKSNRRPTKRPKGKPKTLATPMKCSNGQVASSSSEEDVHNDTPPTTIKQRSRRLANSREDETSGDKVARHALLKKQSLTNQVGFTLSKYKIPRKGPPQAARAKSVTSLHVSAKCPSFYSRENDGRNSGVQKRKKTRDEDLSLDQPSQYSTTQSSDTAMATPTSGLKGLSLSIETADSSSDDAITGSTGFSRRQFQEIAEHEVPRSIAKGRRRKSSSSFQSGLSFTKVPRGCHF
ncbi:expressed unknown protein [Seminavis robusta]|uniref:Uncharacterized protein n=1 Tax=Seminavis robusta TaxID=568900 RepID=A0A9N8DP26_9STRA|nr:expressed unknown protein [Seminavis robusta]|eukprot:Sro256_g100590.1 n/a (1043) ;mRNA; f:24573-27701